MDDGFYQEADSLDSVTVSYKYKSKNNMEIILICLAFSLIVCNSIGIYIYAMLGMSGEYLYMLAHPMQKWDDFSMSAFGCMLCWIMTSYVLVNKIGGYTLIFNNNGISGTYNSLFISNGDFIKAVTVKTRHTSYIIFDIDYIDDKRYISWDNFKSFSRYDDCIVLWRNKRPQYTLGIRILMRYDSWGLLARQNCPLKVCGTRSELADLQDFLSQRLPQVQPI